ncbi:HlyD family type I secretion periplasmic adaptor subunit [Algihabitans albus]|uniref:HlyD family type I secretion periplasmic adaptor subunit n=1 Tax=Algihabitans albus TaxID=2164067 RepID=UPI0035D07381
MKHPPEPQRRPEFKRSARKAILAGVCVAALTFGGLGTWAASADLASAVLAPGTFVVEGDRKLVQHLEGGVVSQLFVKDGDSVEAGQLLLSLDATQVRASLGVLRANLDAALAERARLVAEREEKAAIVFPDALIERGEDPGVQETVTGQNRLFEARLAAFEGRVEVLRQRIAQLKEEITGIEAQQRSKTRQVALIGEELAGLQELFAKGLTEKPRILALQRDQARLEGERGEHLAAIARAKKAIGETELEILQSTLQRQEEISTSLREVQTRILDLSERIAAARDRVDKIELRAPTAGVVVSLAITTEGAVLQPGETVLEIVPHDTRLVIEAKLRPDDIDSVAVGQTARLRLTALVQRTTPTLTGRVIYVSADRLEEQRSGEPYFLALVALDPDQIARLEGQPVLPGMPAEVMVETGARTALDYLVQPISDTLAKAWRES